MSIPAGLRAIVSALLVPDPPRAAAPGVLEYAFTLRERLVGLGLIVGLFTGIAAFFTGVSAFVGGLMTVNYLPAG